jgi:hypothetical protein
MALPTATTPIAKSLHTLTVLVQVARLHIALNPGAVTPALAMDSAMVTLGLAGRPDPYGLQAKALGLLLKAQA